MSQLQQATSGGSEVITEQPTTKGKRGKKKEAVVEADAPAEDVAPAKEPKKGIVFLKKVFCLLTSTTLV